MIRGLIRRNWMVPAGHIVWTLLLGCAVVASAQQAVESTGPREVVAQATDRIMALVREAPDYFEEDPDRYIDGVGEELDRVVDFRGFARGVMGSYASAERYRSLDKTEQQRLREQLDQFTDVLRVGMVSTYSRGLLAFGGYGDGAVMVLLVLVLCWCCCCAGAGAAAVLVLVLLLCWC